MDTLDEALCGKPRNDASTLIGMDPSPAGRAARPRTLLFVDDEENIVAALKRLLRREGYRILTANSGQQGLEQLAGNDVDVIISDQRMPNMTGVEFLRRATDSYPDTVRIVLSGYTELSSITDAINEGAIYKFLTKPWDDALLRTQIQEAFRHKAIVDENRRLTFELEATNRALAAVNTELHATLERLRERSARDGMSLEVVREALQYVPLPIVGVGDDGIIAFANESAQALMSDMPPLLGADAADVLPHSLLALLHGCEGACPDIDVGGARYRASCSEMGRRSTSRGKLLVLVPHTGAGVAGQAPC